MSADKIGADEITAAIVERIRAAIAEITGGEAETFTATSRLVGDGAVVDSQGLLEILLGLEDFAAERFGKPFEWMNDAAFSAKRSPFANVGTLAVFMAGQMGAA